MRWLEQYGDIATSATALVASSAALALLPERWTAYWAPLMLLGGCCGFYAAYVNRARQDSPFWSFVFTVRRARDLDGLVLWLIVLMCYGVGLRRVSPMAVVNALGCLVGIVYFTLHLSGQDIVDVIARWMSRAVVAGVLPAATVLLLVDAWKMFLQHHMTAAVVAAVLVSCAGVILRIRPEEPYRGYGIVLSCVGVVLLGTLAIGVGASALGSPHP